MKSRLVRKYHQFEKETITEDFAPVNMIEGRKVRWIVIYAIFQILASVISAPKEVQDTDGLSYPLCCQKPKTMPWMMETESKPGVASSVSGSMRSKDGAGKDVNCTKQALILLHLLIA